MMRVTITGVAGRMGRMLAEAVFEREDTTLSGATECPGHPWIGKDLGTCLNQQEIGVLVEDNPGPVFGRSDAVLDFTAPTATVAHAALAEKAGLIHVVGTTGLTDEDLAELTAAASQAVMIRAGNFSLGVTLLTLLTRKVAAALDTDFDIEIVEAHHKMKVDAPSGTALMLAEAAADGRGVTLADVADRGRDGITGARRPGDIGMVAVRGGDVVGEHDVVFAGPGERLILRHLASDRMIYARGAVKAALWGRGKKPGTYDMADVLDIK